MTYLERHLGCQVELLRQANIMKQTSTVPSLFINHIIGEGSFDDRQTKVENTIGVIKRFRVEMRFREFRNYFRKLGCRRRQVGGRVWFGFSGLDICKEDFLVARNWLPIT